MERQFFQSMRYENGALLILDQRRLPQESVWIEAKSLEEVSFAIKSMAVRGAPAIAAAALFGLAIDVGVFALSKSKSVWEHYRHRFDFAIKELQMTRPTAVNLFNVLEEIKEKVEDYDQWMPIWEVNKKLIDYAKNYWENDLVRNSKISSFGADYILEHLNPLRKKRLPREKLGVLTHCNTGGLATGGIGTALGVIRELFRRGVIENVYVSETRPWLQGARLTMYELMADKIPCVLVVDSSASLAMSRGKIDFVIVGADRIAANGDTANKIGTYTHAISAYHHKIDFYVAASVDTIDRSIDHGGLIKIEERDPNEVKRMGGSTVTLEDAKVWNPGFDVTPADLIKGIITEKGVFKAPLQLALTRITDF